MNNEEIHDILMCYVYQPINGKMSILSDSPWVDIKASFLLRWINEPRRFIKQQIREKL